jgi:hypothetical protein
VAFKERVSEQAAKFGVFISHEEIAEHIPLFGRYSVNTANLQTFGDRA